MYIQDILVMFVHYGYHAVVELIIDLGDHYVTHVFMLVVLKAGVLHGCIVVVKRVRKHAAKTKAKSSEIVND